MALPVIAVDVLKNYLCGVMERADHHAGNVNEVALSLVGAILWRMDEGTEIEVMVREGATKNVLWVHIGGKRYAFVYNHTTGEIDLHEHTLKGSVLHRFSNGTPQADVRRIFLSL